MKCVGRGLMMDGRGWGRAANNMNMGIDCGKRGDHVAHCVFLLIIGRLVEMMMIVERGF